MGGGNGEMKGEVEVILWGEPRERKLVGGLEGCVRV